MLPYQLDEHIRLEMPSPEHATEAALAVHRNLDRLSQWMPWAVENYSEEHARQWIARTREQFEKDGSFSAIILFDGRIIGSVGFHGLDVVNRHAAIGYWIDADFEGKGVVTRCCIALIDYLFDTLGLNRVQINCNIHNTRSRAIPERLGFRHEGVLRNVEFLNGSFRDWAVYSMLRSEWKSQIDN